VDELVATVVERCDGAATLSKRMVHDTGTRLKDWLDTITALRTPALRARLLDVGFERRAMPGAPDCFVHQGGLFPRIVLEDRAATRLFVKVDSVIDFLSAWHIADDPRTATDNVEGDPASAMRQARAFMGDGAEVWVVERHGYRGFVAPKPDAERGMLMLRHLEAFRRRARDFDSDSAGLDHVDRLVDAAIADLGEDVACATFFEAEREYWLRRNRAAQVQKSRQDKLGLGWANHDHHTYRSSRECFTRLVALFEKPSLDNAMIAIAIVLLPHFVRLTRASALSELRRDYVTASRVAGASIWRLMFITVLPNCMGPMIVQATLSFSTAVLDAAALGFLGMGAQPPTPEWGTMLADAREFIATDKWWVVTLPGIMILVSVIAFNLMGDGLRDALDPKLKRS